MSIMFNEIYTQRHTHIYIYIYIYDWTPVSRAMGEHTTQLIMNRNIVCLFVCVHVCVCVCVIIVLQANIFEDNLRKIIFGDLVKYTVGFHLVHDTLSCSNRNLSFERSHKLVLFIHWKFPSFRISRRPIDLTLTHAIYPGHCYTNKK